MRRTRKKPGLIRWLYRWHRRVALAALFFILLVSLTGIILNHTAALKLDQVEIENPLVLNLYGRDIEEITSPDFIALDDDMWLAHLSGTLYGPSGPVTAIEALRGAVSTGDIVVVAGRQEILLLSPQGELLERLGWAEDVIRIGWQGENILLETEAGISLCDSDFLDCRSTATLSAATWSKVRKARTEEQEKLAYLYRGHGLSLYRLILDIHTLRVVGPLGPWILDLAVLALLFVSLTGFYMWFKRRGG